MNKIFCVTSTRSIGGTFLDWSIHYLAGETQFYNSDLGWVELTSSPLTDINSHNHKKNHPLGATATVNAIRSLSTIEGNETLSVYAFTVERENVADNLEINNEPASDNLIIEFQQKDYANLWDQCDANHVPIVYISFNSDPIFYQSIRVYDQWVPGTRLTETELRSKSEIRDNFLNTYFGNSRREWHRLGLNSVWDNREFIALNIRPYSMIEIDKFVNFSISHYYLDAKELYYNGKDTLINIMQYLDIEINEDRLTAWIPIYLEWQQKQSDILKFSWNIDHICNCIVNNKYYDISRYNLDLWHEAIIQHIMIYKYGLNFKTWNLEKFPNNTQDLYKLLEPNIHLVEDIYGIKS